LLAALLLVVSAVAVYLLPGRFLLFSAERALAGVYAEERPFAVRFPGWRYGRVRVGPGSVRMQTLMVALARVLSAQRFVHDEAKAQLLLGRIALLNGSYEDATAHYLRSLTLGSHNRSAELEFAGALLMRAKQQHRPVDLAVALEYAGRAHQFEPVTAVDSYNLALLYESIPAPYLARDEWARCLRLERDPQYRAEVSAHWQVLNERIERRAARVRAVRGGAALFLKEAAARPFPPETALENAVPAWLDCQDADPFARRALLLVADQLRAQHGDPWLFDLMQLGNIQRAGPGYRLLAEAFTDNRDGQHSRAAAAAAGALDSFRSVGNRPGELRARLELVIADHRTVNGPDCLAGAHALVLDLQSTPYSWLKAYAWLEETTCNSIVGNARQLVSERENALAWIRRTHYQGLELRALGFLVQPELIRANPMRLWRIVHEGLTQFWAGDIYATRAQQLYFAAALSSGEFPLASVVMAREGVRVMGEVGNPQWQALARSSLGSMELSAGLESAAAKTFRDAEGIFAACPQTRTVQRYRLEAATSRAEAEVAAGNPEGALARLVPLESEFSDIGDTDETAPFEQILGTAYLRLGDYDKAAALFRQVVTQARAALARVDNQRQRDGLLHAADMAYRGQIFLQLVRDHNAPGAFAVWRSFRAQRIGQALKDEPLPEDVSLLAIVSLPGGSAVFGADHTGVDAKWVPAGKVRLDELARGFAALCGLPSSSEA